MFKINIKRSGFSILDLLLALIILAVLAAVMLPAFTRAREAARRTTCAQNLGQLHKALTMYETDYALYPTRAKAKANKYTDGDAQEALNLLFRQYVDDTRVFSCPSRQLARTMLAGITPSTAKGWPAGNGASLQEAAPGVAGNSTSYGYSPGHDSSNSRVLIMADRQGTGALGNSDNHGRDAGMNVLFSGGNVEFRYGKNAKRNDMGKDDDGAPVFDSDIYKWDTVTPKKYSDWDSVCR